jgi:NADH:ubiquinone oxidoreductase subunit F (NADH-binding)/NADH:ubiquinone oxidoreductase subunit E/NAD-dependent dihydropyrimidine dehydrogenase PreA subunit
MEYNTAWPKEPMTESNPNIDGIVSRIVELRGRSEDAVIPILQEIQQEFQYLPEEALKKVCELTEITPSRITGISTFYGMFRHRPVGKHSIKVCTGTACHVKGALLVYDAFCRELKLKDHEDTDTEGLFTIEKVACLGCCTIAPVVRIDSVTYGQVLPEKAGEILADFLENKAGREAPAKPAAETMVSGQGEIRIGLGSCCIASGSEEVKAELEKTLAENKIRVDVKQVGCVGICHQVPVLEVIKPGEPASYYVKIRPEEVRQVVLEHFRPEGWMHRIKAGVYNVFNRITHDGSPSSFRRYTAEERENPVDDFLGPQVSIATGNRGVVRPTDLEEYRRSGGFEALRRCLLETVPQTVVDEITRSGLRGRGGAGFPTGKKWQMVRDEQSVRKFVICNGDEGDPGAFMDRMILESYPYRVIEGMLIAGYATGASEGILYIRAEYPLAVSRIREALGRCRESGLLGTNILGSTFPFQINIFEGAGAFVCGEETALIASIEGNRGYPRVRPPYPSEKGLWGYPTLVSNTETFAFISWIIRNGADAFARIGVNGSRGTKVFALAGKVNRGGLIEVPMGMTIRQIVEEIGGGIAGGKQFKAVQVGGPSGGCIPASLADLVVDYEALTEVGAMMGSGGMVVMDETDCMVDIAHYFLSFTQNQSCGRCTFCRVGTRRMLELLENIRNGKAVKEDLKRLEHLAGAVRRGSLCGLGKTAPNPVLSTLIYFREEYEAHLEGKCPAGKCLSLITYSITDECIGCTKCAQRCPTGAIPFKPFEVHTIEQEKCIKCGICKTVCPVNSVLVE